MQFQPSRVPTASAPVEHPFAANFQQATANVTQTAVNFEQARRDRQDFILEQNRSAAMQDAANSLNMEMQERLLLGNGVPGSLYTAEGLLDKEAISELKQKYLAVADAWTSGFTTEEGMISATNAQRQFRNAVTQAIDIKLTAGLKARAEAALSNNIQAAIRRGAYDDARAFAQNAHARGFQDAAQTAILLDDINLADHQNRINSSRDPFYLDSYLQDPANAAIFAAHPQLVEKAQHRIDSLLRYSSTGSEKIVATTAYQQDAQGTTRSSTSAHKTSRAQAPVGADGYLALHFTRYGDDLESMEAQRAAHALFLRFVGSKAGDAYDNKTQSLNEQTLFEADLLADSLKLPAAVKNRIIDARNKQLQEALPHFSASTAKKDLLDTFNRSQSLAKKYAPDWTSGFNMQKLQLENTLNLAESDFYTWLAAHPEANNVEQARTFQQLLYKHRTQEMADNPAMGWNHMRLEEYIDRYETAANYNAARAHEDLKQSKLYKQSLANETALYEAIKQYPALQALYYTTGSGGAQARRLINQTLEFQAKHVNLESPMGPPSSATNLPDTHTKLLIYAPNKDIFNGMDSLLIHTKDDTFTVEIAESPDVQNPVFSILLQSKLKLLGKQYNNFTFADNVFTFTNVKRAQEPRRNMLHKQQTTPANDTTFVGDDGLLTEEGLFAGIPAPDESTDPLPL